MNIIGKLFGIVFIVISAGCASQQDIEYNKVSDYFFFSKPNQMSRAESGSFVEKYIIKDNLLGITLDYNLYHTNPDTKIGGEIYHIQGSHGEKQLYIAEGRRKLYKISRQELEQATGCHFTGGTAFTQSHPRFASSSYNIQQLDLSKMEIEQGDLMNYQGCLFYEPGSRAFPVFISSGAQSQTILVATIQEGLAGAVDYSRVNTLQR